MAGELLVRGSALYDKTSSYARIGDSWTDITTIYAYRVGHTENMYLRRYDNWFAHDAYNMYIRYRLSNTGSWVLSNSRSIGDGAEGIFNCASLTAHRQYIRWQCQWSASGGDGVSRTKNCTVFSRSCYSTDHNYAKGLKLYRSAFKGSTSAVNPDFYTNVPLTTAHIIFAGG